jgi:DNA-directed RNA polymerase subunit RPC12/RpoP
MPKSKASEATAQEIEALKLDLESVNSRAEEIGGKVDGVQSQMEELSAKFSRLEAILTANMDKQAPEKEIEPAKQPPSGSGEKDEYLWHDGPPHLRRKHAPPDDHHEQPHPDAGQNEEARYENYYPPYQEHDRAAPEQRQQYYETQPYFFEPQHPYQSYPQSYEPPPHHQPNPFPPHPNHYQPYQHYPQPNIPHPPNPHSYYQNPNPIPYPPPQNQFHFTYEPPHPNPNNYRAVVDHGVRQQQHENNGHNIDNTIARERHREEDREHRNQGYPEDRGRNMGYDRGQYQRYDRNQPLDRDAQFYKSIAKAPKMDFPHFDGSNPEEWLRTTEKYFEMVYVPEDEKFNYAQMYITGRADTWLRNSGVLKEKLTWKQFRGTLITRFATSNSYDIVEEFNNIKQGANSVDDYTDRFEIKMADYKKENPDVKDPYYIKCYINGLHAEIKHQLRSFEPKTLSQAVEHARNMERSVLAAAQYSKKLFSSNIYTKNNYTSSSFTRPKQVTEVVPVRMEGDRAIPKPETKMENKPRDNNCKYCGQKWFFGHRCQQYKRLNLMTAEGDYESAEETLQEQDTSEEENTEQPAADTPAPATHMQISLNAVQGKSLANTFTFTVLIGGKKGIGLSRHREHPHFY